MTDLTNLTDWQLRWQQGEIGWHQSRYNARLLKYIKHLDLAVGVVFFVPLCGKSLDMIYLLKQGYKVIGVELSELAVKAFFSENKLDYKRDELGDFVRYQGDDIIVYAGDFFKLSGAMLSLVGGVYDRASLIALPEVQRKRYALHLSNILPQRVKMLLLTLNYPQTQRSGPPFAVDKNEVNTLFSKHFDCTILGNVNDLKNEPKFIEAQVDFLYKTSYLLKR